MAARLKTPFIDVKNWHNGVKKIQYESVWLGERKRPEGNDRAGEGKQEREVDDRDRDKRWEDVESWKTERGRGEEE